MRGSKLALRGISVLALLGGAALLLEFAGAQTPTSQQKAKRIASARAIVAKARSAGGNGGGIDPSGIPAGWTCVGNCGTDGNDGVVHLSPSGNSAYEWVSTSGGVLNVGALPTGSLGQETDGSTLATPVFASTAGSALKFYFNYVTSDGAGYADYAWAELFTSANTPVALLFTARTETSGSIIPGTGLPAPAATLSPASVPIVGGAPTWAPLGAYSNTCYDLGCGYTGWVSSTYNIATAGNYYLKVGVVNWSDENYDTGLAVDGVTIGGVTVGPTPAPTPGPPTLLLTIIGLAAAGIYVAFKFRPAQG